MNTAQYYPSTAHLVPIHSPYSNQGRNGLGNIYVWASGDGGADDDCNCDGYAASMWTVSINSAINDGSNAHYDESCSSTLASTFSNGAKDPNTGVVSIMSLTIKAVLNPKRVTKWQRLTKVTRVEAR